MNHTGQNVYYLAPVDIPGQDVTLLAFPSELGATDGYDVNNGFGIFVFPRSEKNRGKPRKISFPAIQGFGDEAEEFEVTLTTDFAKSKNSHRLVCAQDDTRPYLSDLAFSARKLPLRLQLTGEASRLKGYSLWGLVPENRDILEDLWQHNQFYLMGYGHIPDDIARDLPAAQSN